MEVNYSKGLVREKNIVEKVGERWQWENEGSVLEAEVMIRWWW